MNCSNFPQSLGFDLDLNSPIPNTEEDTQEEFHKFTDKLELDLDLDENPTGATNDKERTPESLTPKKVETKKPAKQMYLSADQERVNKMTPEEYEIFYAEQM